ncbi:CBS domain containing-hemolysin-like protein [Microbacterium sp. W4I4]|uniref:hemolysin family protein n=1 Tax=Microbacterium sp. W4I4 TaxID=3042295 RepID=UPI002782A33F|nr:hemolysin family protein [Microbacterium sp. W4I4]MDQ0613245.1 CBS domain containing-hemolysin-like protein [Microbacterium sp. W4I4]
MSDWAGLVWLVVLLLANAFFVGGEFAVISARRSQIEPLAERGSRSAKTALYAMEHATLMLATSQLGITICSLLILNVSEPAIHHLLEIPMHAIGWDPTVISVAAFVITLALVSFLHVVFGEMVPKNLAFSVPDRAVLILAPPLVWVSRVFRHVIWALNGSANAVLRLFRVEPKTEAASTFTIDEVATIVDRSRREGVLSDTSGAVAAAVEFTDKKARDVAVPLAELITLPASATPADVEKAVARYGFSRYVIVDAEDAPIGYVHLKDVLRSFEEDGADDKADVPLPAKRIHHMIPVQEDTDLEDALAAMRRGGRHLAKVRDMRGETTAVLFLEDILEELVGEVQDATRRGRGR